MAMWTTTLQLVSLHWTWIAVAHRKTWLKAIAYTGVGTGEAGGLGPLTLLFEGPNTIIPISILYRTVGHTLQDCFHTECSISSKGEVWKAQHWPHHFPSLDFTSSCAECKADTRDTSIVSVGNEQSLCPLMWDTREKWGHLKNASRLHYAHHLQIASDATDRLFRLPRYVYIGYHIAPIPHELCVMRWYVFIYWSSLIFLWEGLSISRIIISRRHTPSSIKWKQITSLKL